MKDIWVTYLSKFVKRYGKAKLERARELFEHAIEMVFTLFPPLNSCLAVSAIEILSANTYFCSYINFDESCCKWG